MDKDQGYDPDVCKEGKSHDWVNYRRPRDNRSGWHEDKCRVCGQIRCYDTSD